jgi:HEAT repeat protein
VSPTVVAASALLAAAALAVVVALAGRRIVLAARERRDGEAARRLRPLAFAVIEGDQVDLACLSTADRAALAAVLTRLARQLDGAARARVADYFTAERRLDATLAGLGHRRAWRRASAAHALGDMASPAVAAALLVALRDPVREVRAAAARSLGRLGGAGAVPALVAALVDGHVPRVVAGQALISIGPAAVPALRTCASADRAETRAIAVELLGLVGAAGDADACLERLVDTSASVRSAAATALGRLGAAGAVRALGGALDDRIPAVRAAAATALGAIGDPRVVPALVAQAGDDSPVPARAAAHAVLHIDPDAAREAARSRPAARFLLEVADLAELRAA